MCWQMVSPLQSTTPGMGKQPLDNVDHPWNASINLTWRYIGKSEQLYVEPNDIQSMNYFDLSAIWDATEYFSFRLGVNNLFDEDPPLANGGPEIFGNGNTFPGIYDALGRYIFVGIRATF